MTREKEEDEETIYWADVTLGGRQYEVGVLENGTLSEMNLTTDEEEIPFDRCPAAVQATFQAEGYGVKVATVAKDMKYGVTIFEATIEHKGKSYQIVIAEDGTLVEKVLVIDDEDVEIKACPTAVQTTLREHAKGGMILGITRTTGITSRPTRPRSRSSRKSTSSRSPRTGT